MARLAAELRGAEADLESERQLRAQCEDELQAALDALAAVRKRQRVNTRMLHNSYGRSVWASCKQH